VLKCHAKSGAILDCFTEPCLFRKLVDRKIYQSKRVTVRFTVAVSCP
jgi:hypothetical protein